MAPLSKMIRNRKKKSQRKRQKSRITNRTLKIKKISKIMNNHKANNKMNF